MTQASRDQDQSMEEILQSIKRIIAEEGEPAPAIPDVLELTDLVVEDDTVAEEPAHVEPTKVVADLTIDEIMAGSTGEMPEAVPEIKPEPKAAAAKPREIIPEPVVPPPAVEESLISDETFKAAAAAFDKLKEIPPEIQGNRGGLGFRSGTTVEDLVLESLRPVMREWLDENLPELVERLVEREVRKISSR